MNPIKKVVLDIINKNIGFVEGMEVEEKEKDSDGHTEVTVKLNGKYIGSLYDFNVSIPDEVFEKYVMLQPFIKGLKNKTEAWQSGRLRRS